MLYFIFTVDGDWKEYFNVDLTDEQRLPSLDLVRKLIDNETAFLKEELNGKFIHFIHTSIRVPTFFLKEPFLAIWKRIIDDGADIGLHCHAEDPYKEYYFKDIPRMERIIGEALSILREADLDVTAYRGGFLAFCAQLIPVLEKNGLCFDFSCEPDRLLIHGNNVVSDWRGSPSSFYRLSYRDHRREGSSKVFEIPVGSYEDEYIYFEKSSAKMLEVIASGLEDKAKKEKKDIVVSVLTHTFEYTSDKDMKNIKGKIDVLKEYGRFINIKELKHIIEGCSPKR